MRSGGVPARGRGRASRMSSPHIDPELELGTTLKPVFLRTEKTCPKNQSVHLYIVFTLRKKPFSLVRPSLIALVVSTHPRNVTNLNPVLAAYLAWTFNSTPGPLRL
jgi:hypothetical protein